MADRSEREKILEVAVSGIPRIAKVIADFPIEFREGALEVAERRYQQTVCDLGYSEADAQGWISIVHVSIAKPGGRVEHEEAGR
jgi:hypothetical protein